MIKVIDRMQKANWPVIVSRAAGIAILLMGVLLAAGLCSAVPQDHPISNIFDSRSTPTDSIRRLSFFVLSVTGIIFVVVLMPAEMG